MGVQRTGIVVVVVIVIGTPGLQRQPFDPRRHIDYPDPGGNQRFSANYI